MQLTRWLGVVAIVAVTSPALADIFVWRDGAGISHYTTDLANVPAEFRKDAIAVAKDWARAAPPPEPAPPPPAAAAVNEDSRAAREGYEAAYAAGYRAGEDDVPTAAANTNVGTVVQNVQVEPAAPGVVDRLVPVPVIIERRSGRLQQPPRQTDSRDARNSLVPASRAPYLQGPAGPPPVSDR